MFPVGGGECGAPSPPRAVGWSPGRGAARARWGRGAAVGRGRPGRGGARTEVQVTLHSRGATGGRGSHGGAGHRVEGSLGRPGSLGEERLPLCVQPLWGQGGVEARRALHLCARPAELAGGARSC